jgi:hypothetical protein
MQIHNLYSLKLNILGDKTLLDKILFTKMLIDKFNL